MPRKKKAATAEIKKGPTSKLFWLVLEGGGIAILTGEKPTWNPDDLDPDFGFGDWRPGKGGLEENTDICEDGLKRMTGLELKRGVAVQVQLVVVEKVEAKIKHVVEEKVTKFPKPKR